MRILAKCVASCLILGALTLVAAGQVSSVGGAKKKVQLKVKVGDPAPTFESVDDSGKPFKSSDVVGKKLLVLYFYPADFTGGCTKQACGFRDDVEKLSSKGIEVIGVSADSVATHKLFKNYHKLNFPLLSDEKGTVASVFGIPYKAATAKATGINEKGEKVDVVRSGSISRWTVVIDKAGKIAAIDAISDPQGDAKRVAEMIKKLDTK